MRAGRRCRKWSGRARRMGVLIYSIGIGDPNSSKLGFGIGSLLFGGNRDHVDAEMLRQLSTESGARTYLLAKSATVNCCARIASRSATSCASSTQQGSWCRIPRCRVIGASAWISRGRPELAVRARAKALPVGPGAPPSYAGASEPNPGVPNP